MQRILGLDIGDKYIGIAVSDPLRITAQPYRTYKRGTREDDLSFFNDLITQYNVETIVCGLPLNIDGTESAQTRKTVNYANFLRNHTDLKDVKYVNETLTSIEADQILDESGVSRGRSRKNKIDTVAAQLILQEYLEELNNAE